MQAYLRRYSRFSEVFCHQAILQIGEAGAFLEMVFRQEHVPQPKLLRPSLYIVDYGRVRGPSLLAFAELGVVDNICRNAFFLDEFLDLTI